MSPEQMTKAAEDMMYPDDFGSATESYYRRIITMYQDEAKQLREILSRVRDNIAMPPNHGVNLPYCHAQLKKAVVSAHVYADLDDYEGGPLS